MLDNESKVDLGNEVCMAAKAALGDMREGTRTTLTSSEVVDVCNVMQEITLPSQVVPSTRLLKKIQKAKTVFQNNDILSGLIPPAFTKTVANCIAEALQMFNHVVDCPNPKKYPCKGCNLCFQKFLNERLCKGLCANILKKLHVNWGTRCGLDGARQRGAAESQSGYFYGARGGGSGNNTIAATTQVRQVRMGKRGTSVGDRELMFFGVENYILRHMGCHKCNGKMPKLKRCMCVNDSATRGVPLDGLGVWGGTRCEFCIANGYLVLGEAIT
jgi:hypothetical protein